MGAKLHNCLPSVVSLVSILMVLAWRRTASDMTPGDKSKDSCGPSEEGVMIWMASMLTALESCSEIDICESMHVCTNATHDSGLVRSFGYLLLRQTLTADRRRLTKASNNAWHNRELSTCASGTGPSNNLHVAQACSHGHLQ